MYDWIYTGYIFKSKIKYLGELYKSAIIKSEQVTDTFEFSFL